MNACYTLLGGGGEKMDTATANVANLEARAQEICEENCKLNELITKCQQKAHKFGLEVKKEENLIF